MIISDAKTPQEFRLEISEEFDRRIDYLKKSADVAINKKTQERLIYAFNELRALQTFMNNIQFKN